MLPEILTYIQEKFRGPFDMAVVLGSGLGSFADALDTEIDVSTSEIPLYPSSTVPGHDGRMLVCRIHGRRVLLFKGRIHYYEGNSIGSTALPALITAELKIPKLVITNAAGGINPLYRVGDIMLINDYLISPLGPAMGFSLRALYDTSTPERREFISDELIRRIRDIAHRQGVHLQEGVYGFCTGPSYETRAEIAFFRKMGVDAVGMSSVPEIIVARRAGIEVLGFSCITNEAKTVSTPVSHSEVTQAASDAAESFEALLNGLIADA